MCSVHNNYTSIITFCTYGDDDYDDDDVEAAFSSNCTYSSVLNGIEHIMLRVISLTRYVLRANYMHSYTHTHKHTQQRTPIPSSMAIIIQNWVTMPCNPCPMLFTENALRSGSHPMAIHFLYG